MLRLSRLLADKGRMFSSAAHRRVLAPVVAPPLCHEPATQKQETPCSWLASDLPEHPPHVPLALRSHNPANRFPQNPSGPIPVVITPNVVAVPLALLGSPTRNVIIAQRMLVAALKKRAHVVELWITEDQDKYLVLPHQQNAPYTRRELADSMTSALGLLKQQGINIPGVLVNVQDTCLNLSMRVAPKERCDRQDPSAPSRRTP